VFLSLLIILVASIIILSCVPPVSKDELVHHLAVPKLYLKHGGMVEIPFMDFSYYPMNVDLLYLLPLYFGNDIIPKFIHFTFGLLTSWLLFSYLKRRTSTTVALFGVTLLLSIPVVVKLSITAYVDLGLMFFSFAALILLLKWKETRFKPLYLLLSAMMTGLAMGVKYNGLLVWAVLAFLVPLLYARGLEGKTPGFLRPAGLGAVFFLVALLVFSPWAVRNYQWTKNPVYPLYDAWFNPARASLGENAPEHEQERSPSGHFLFRKVVFGETGWEIALLPVRVFFQGRDGDPRYFDGKLNPFLFLLPFFAFMRRKEDDDKLGQERKAFLFFSVLFLAVAFLSTDLRIRYIAPIIPPLVVLSAFGLHKVSHLFQTLRGKRARWLGTVLVWSAGAFALALNGRYLLTQFESVQPFTYLCGKVSRDEYIAKHRPEYPAMKFINEKLPPDVLISFIFLGNRGYYCERDYVFGESQLERTVKEANTPEGILSGLARAGITHLFIHDPILGKWAMNRLSEKDLNKLNDFFNKYSKIIYSYKSFTVLSLEKPLS
jgi:4-amino-4-deoxy-L-arabinose transferase-like glycosyltransferase